ncbi:ABC transporter permease subunit [Halorussus sp. MSC15.2]|uniref:ABC transporter permease subunit n=1 Tax=Halorussus sp. MSC15.2 TaxID=2283638 RepID=UPI0013D16C59|nr:ABC transporter permease subunit [Halorussus sp. MSC15.2]NEU57563.1 ABC transporter permease [Halorussus sp. MSC15.2]
MSLRAVVRKDFKDVRRAKLLWFVGGIYTLFAVLFFYTGSTGENPRVLLQLWNMSGLAVLFIPLVALVAAYLSIAGERESGSMKFLLSIPNRRRDVVFGKYLSRAAVVTGAILLAFGVAAVLSAVWYPDLELPTFARVVGLTLYFTLAYVSVAVGISALTASRSRAMAGSIGYFFVFNVLWIQGSAFSVVGALRFVFEDTLGVALSSNTESFVRSLSPTTAYLQSLELAFPPGYRDIPAPDPSTPFYLEPEFMLVILAVWVVGPLLVGYWRFERAELG